ncbi:extended Signal Peptide of Type V secretion system family protein [Escherichia coli p0305293.2]|nr:extended Signal Peptide of Type V secretion system family protein [Escherichia coli p0305293.2]
MKRHLNTSYRLVWNHITGTLVVASELARSRGKRTGVAVALSLATITSVPVLAADTVVQAGETVSDGTLTNHDNQIVFGTANGMTISTGWSMGRITRPIPADNGYKMAVSPTTLLSPVVVFRE